MDMLKQSFELLKNPAAIVKRKNKADLWEGIKMLAIAGAIAGALAGFIAPLLIGSIGGAVTGLIVGAIAGAIFVPIGGLIGNAVLWLVAKVLGGRATFTQQFYLIAWPSMSAVIISTILQVIPFIGGLLAMVFGLWMLYVEIIVLRDAHQFTILRALATVLIILVAAFIVAMILAAMIMALFFTMFGASMMGSAAASGY